MLQELDKVIVNKDISEEKLKAGMIGTIVHIATKPNIAYMVEFCDNYGQTILSPFLLPDQISKIDNLTKEQYQNRVMPEGSPM